MCKAIDDMRKESMAAGKAEGMAAGEAKNLNQNIKTMYKNGADENLIAKFLDLDINFVKTVLAKQYKIFISLFKLGYLIIGTDLVPFFNLIVKMRNIV